MPLHQCTLVHEVQLLSIADQGLGVFYSALVALQQEGGDNNGLGSSITRVFLSYSLVLGLEDI